MGQLEATAFLRDGSRKSALLVTEEFALDQPRGNGGAIQLDQRPLAAVAETVYGPADQLLARARLAQDEGRGICGGDAFHLLEGALQARAGARDLLVVVAVPDLVQQGLLDQVRIEVVDDYSAHEFAPVLVLVDGAVDDDGDAAIGRCQAGQLLGLRESVLEHLESEAFKRSTSRGWMSLTRRLVVSSFSEVPQQLAGGLIGLDDAIGLRVDQEDGIGHVPHQVLVLGRDSIPPWSAKGTETPCPLPIQPRSALSEVDQLSRGTAIMRCSDARAPSITSSSSTIS